MRKLEEWKEMSRAFKNTKEKKGKVKGVSLKINVCSKKQIVFRYEQREM